LVYLFEESLKFCSIQSCQIENEGYENMKN